MEQAVVLVEAYFEMVFFMSLKETCCLLCVQSWETELLSYANDRHSVCKARCFSLAHIHIMVLLCL